MDPTEAAQSIRKLILNLKEPVIIKNVLDWELLGWDLEKWREILQEEKLTFRRGQNAFTEDPQWERTTSCLQMTFSEFLTYDCSKSKDWIYFDYKYLREWLTSIGVLRKIFSSCMKQELWSHSGFSPVGHLMKCMGFPDVSVDDCTIWIGSKGAHTPCHIDTYGCNLIAQVYGRKQWLVFPPTEDLKPTRVPYEESSIYSKLNFFSPDNLKDFEGIKDCRRIILQPGDVLFLPSKWWHYVENLETAISINVWLPEGDDDEQRLSEALVQLLTVQLAKELDEETRKAILNPNSDDDIETSLKSLIDMVFICKDIHEDNSRKSLDSAEETNRTPTDELLENLKNSGTVKSIPQLSESELKDFLMSQIDRFPKRDSTAEVCYINDLSPTEKVVKLVEAITHPDVVALIKEKLLK